MARHNFKTDWLNAEETAMPVAMLQQVLDDRSTLAAEPHVDRWSQRRALTFIVVSAGALWMALIVAGAQAAKAVA